MKGNKPIKILHIIHGFGVGGAETWLLACTKYLKDNPYLNIQFDYVLAGGKKETLDDEFLKLGSDLFYIKYSLPQILLFRKKLIKVLKESEYTAVHNHLDFVAGWQYLSVLDKLPRIRIIHLHNPWNFVNNYCSSFGRKISYKIGRWLITKTASSLTGTSDAVMDEYKYVSKTFKKIRINPIYCGFNVSAFKFNNLAKQIVCEELKFNFSANFKIALFVGRVGLHSVDHAKNQKNPELAFEIAKKLVKTNDNWKFLFAGFKGEFGQKLEEKVEKLGLANKIIFLGLRNDIPKLMSASDVLVFPSYWEGLGMVVVEAQANGLNVIMSNTVPKEAVISPELVTCMSIFENTIEEWVDKIIKSDSQNINRETPNKLIAESPFSIENSVLAMMKAYGIGE